MRCVGVLALLVGVMCREDLHHTLDVNEGSELHSALVPQPPGESTEGGDGAEKSNLTFMSKDAILKKYKQMVSDLKAKLRKVMPPEGEVTRDQFNNDHRAILQTWSALNLPSQWSSLDAIAPQIQVKYGTHEAITLSAATSLPGRLAGFESLTGFESCHSESSESSRKFLYVAEAESSPAVGCLTLKTKSGSQETELIEFDFQNDRLKAPMKFQCKASDIPGNVDSERFRQYFDNVRRIHNSHSSPKATGFTQFLSGWRSTLHSFRETSACKELLGDPIDEETVRGFESTALLVVIIEAATAKKINWDRAQKMLPEIRHRGEEGVETFLNFHKAASGDQSELNARQVANPDLTLGILSTFDE